MVESRSESLALSLKSEADDLKKVVNKFIVLVTGSNGMVGYCIN